MREQQVALLNSVANQPEVLAAMAPGYQWVDLSSFLANPKSVLIGDEHGVVLFAYIGDGVYEGHYLLTDSIGKVKRWKLMRYALRELFTTHGAWVINGVTPRDNMAARMVNRALGFHPVGTATDTMGRACIKYKLERDKWVASSAGSSAA